MFSIMFARIITLGKRRMAMGGIGVWAVTLASCGQPMRSGDSPPTVTSGRAALQRQDAPSTATASESDLLAIRAWINEILLAKTPVRISAHRYLDLLDRSRQVEVCTEILNGGPDVYCTGFSELEITLFIVVGHGAIPELIRHVADRRTTPWQFHYPLSSWGPQEGCWRVGKLACYMIEAILRENAYFTRSGSLSYPSSASLSEADKEEYSLNRAAAAYLTWYEDCFDAETGTVTCPPEKFPAVKWDYDLEEWPRWLEYYLKRGGSGT